MSMLIHEAMALASTMRAERRWRSRAATVYWSTCVGLTGLVERWSAHSHRPRSPILNFGCGNNFLAEAVNADLFAPHRYLLRKRRPDLYWRGSSRPPALAARFQAVICEHVIEHLLPDDALELLRGLRHGLAADGVVVVSFPDLHTILARPAVAGRPAALIEANSVVYRHGHRFAYDVQLVRELLCAAGFVAATAGSRCAMPYAALLLEERQQESAYLTARNSGAVESGGSVG